MSTRNDVEKTQTENSRSLIGQTTILILSGYLIGAGSNHSLTTDTSFYMILAGITGGIGYLLFKYVARLRERAATRRQCAEANARLEGFMERHVQLGPIRDRKATVASS